MNKPWENEDGTINCPADAYDCPYFKKGLCTLENAENECDDFYFYYEDAFNDSHDDEEEEDFDEEPSYDLDMGFDPYMGCYTDDC